jgi:hypothetical protein
VVGVVAGGAGTGAVVVGGVVVTGAAVVGGADTGALVGMVIGVEVVAGVGLAAARVVATDAVTTGRAAVVPGRLAAVDVVGAATDDVAFTRGAADATVARIGANASGVTTVDLRLFVAWGAGW